MKENKVYLIRTFILILFLIPLFLSFSVILGIFIGWQFFKIFEMVLLLIPGYFYARKIKLPENAAIRYLPMFMSLMYTSIFWIITMFLSKGVYKSNFFNIYFISHFQYFLFTILFNLININYLMFIFPVIVNILFIISFSIGSRKNSIKILGGKMKALKMGIITLIFVSIGIFQITAKTKEVLGADYKTDSVRDEIDLYQYKPFSENNKLYVFKESPNLVIDSNYPVLDGATAGYPIYAAAVQGIYKGLDEDNIEKYVQCNTTPTAYERLINKEVDAIFVAEPSKKQLEMAESKGVKLKLIPIGREAFVFFVNKKNKVNNLSVGEIQSIYTKKITNWKSVGGKSKKIMPFQRPENSGSQTVMVNKIMKGTEISTPLREEYSQFMGGIIDRVADYRNYEEAIGYSFRYYASGMNKNENIKLLAIDGTEPTAENIKNGKYPYIVNVYLVTREDVRNPNLDSLINWFLSEQGQKMIESIGYVGVK